MRKSILFIMLALSMFSLSACSIESKTVSNTKVASEKEETINEDEKESEEPQETSEEPSEEPEMPKYEPVIALSYDGNEFDISNGTYKDLLAFFQAIGHPVVKDDRDIELEPYYDGAFDLRKIYVTAGSKTEEVIVRLYNPTGETIKVIDSKIQEIRLGGIEYNEEFSDDIMVCGIPFKDFRNMKPPYINHKNAMINRDLGTKFNEYGYEYMADEYGNHVFIKVLEDGRRVIFDEYDIEITPVFEYETD